jgi:phosphocarrier protein HPr
MSHSQELGPGMLEKAVTIRNRRGLHARASAKFVKLVEGFDAEIVVARGDTEVSGLSIMGLMMLAAGPGTDLMLRASGEQAQAALDALAELIDRRFDED